MFLPNADIIILKYPLTVEKVTSVVFLCTLYTQYVTPASSSPQRCSKVDRP